MSCVPTHRFASIRRLPITIQRLLFLTQAIEHCKLCPSRFRFVFSAPFCFPLPLFFALEWRRLAFGVLACTTDSWDKSSCGRSTPPIQLSAFGCLLANHLGSLLHRGSGSGPSYNKPCSSTHGFGSGGVTSTDCMLPRYRDNCTSFRHVVLHGTALSQCSSCLRFSTRCDGKVTTDVAQ